MENIDQYAYPDLEIGDQDYRWCHRYAHDVVTGKIIAGKWVKLACERHLNDLSRDDVYFDVDTAKSIVLWFKFIPITDGKQVGNSTRLYPWQIFLVCNLIAWKWNVDLFESIDGVETQIKFKGTRKYKYAYVQVARKGGKTTLTGGLTLYLMYKSGYFRPRAYAAATKKDQAKLLWSDAKAMIKLSPRLQSVFKARANDILLPSLNGEFKPLASDSNSLDGLNPLVAALDECHAIKDYNLYDVLVSAFGAQDEGLMITITTAGTILDGICRDINSEGKSVLSGETEYDSYFYLIYEIDHGDKWDKEENWYKANPALGYQPKLQYLRDQAIAASMSSAKKANFMTKHLNVFVSGADKWLDMDEVKACRDESLVLSNYYGRECYVSVDRSLVNDITSFCFVFPRDDGGADCFYINILPKQAVLNATKQLRNTYDKAIAVGDLDVVEGAMIRNSYLAKIIIDFHEKFDVLMFGYDPYKMKELAMDMEEKGIEMVAVSQGTGNMSEPAKKLELLIKDKLLHYNDNLFEFACSNAIQGVTKMNNVAIYRDNVQTEKIDPLIATIITLSCATLQKNDVNVYETRDLL